MQQIPTFERQYGDILYPKVLWNRPVSRLGAGRLLVPGGHSSDFSEVTGMYQASMAAGAGECSVVLPDSLVKTLGGMPGTSFVSATPSGSLDRGALARLLELSEEHDSVLIGSNLSNNSLTSLLIERYLSESATPVIAYGDALVALEHNLDSIIQREQCLLIVTMKEILNIARHLGITPNIRKDGGLINKLEIIEAVRTKCKCDFAVYGSELIVSSGNKLGVTPIYYRLGQLPVMYYALISVFWTQNPSARYEGLMTAGYVLAQIAGPLFDDPKSRPSLSDATKQLSRFLNDAF